VESWSRLSRFVEKLLMAVACIILAGTTLSLSAEALARTFFSRTWGLMEELPSLFMPYLVFLLLGVALKRNLHVSVDLLPAFLKGRAKAALEAIISLAAGVGSCFLLYGAMLGVKGFYQMGLDGDCISFVGFLSLTGHWLWTSGLVRCGDVREIDRFYDVRSAVPRMFKGE
jgi:TRAP-type C4-dicarboxylate transport system permease small subunit